MYPPIVPIIKVYKGDTFEQSFVFKTDGVARDLTAEGWGSWSSQIRVTPDAATYVAFTVDSSDAANGRITLRLTATQTNTLTPGEFDLQATRSAEVQTFMRGSLLVEGDITHA